MPSFIWLVCQNLPALVLYAACSMPAHNTMLPLAAAVCSQAKMLKSMASVTLTPCEACDQLHTPTRLACMLHEGNRASWPPLTAPRQQGKGSKALQHHQLPFPSAALLPDPLPVPLKVPSKLPFTSPASEELPLLRLAWLPLARALRVPSWLLLRTMLARLLPLARLLEVRRLLSSAICDRGAATNSMLLSETIDSRRAAPADARVSCSANASLRQNKAGTATMTDSEKLAQPTGAGHRVLQGACGTTAEQGVTDIAKATGQGGSRDRARGKGSGT